MFSDLKLDATPDCRDVRGWGDSMARRQDQGAAAGEFVRNGSSPNARVRPRRRAFVGGSAILLAAVAVSVGYVAGTSPPGWTDNTAAIASSPFGDDALQPRIAAVEPELNGLRHGDAAIAPDLAYRIAMLERRLAETSDRVRALRSTGSAVPGVIALDHLRRRVTQGLPYAEQLISARAFLPETPETAPATAILHAHSVRGVPTISELLESFGRIEPLIATQAARAPGFGVILERFWHDALHLAGFAEERPANPLETGMIAVRRALEKGRVDAAVDAASAMEPELGPIVAGWLSIVRGRLLVERSLETLERSSWQAMLAQRP